MNRKQIAITWILVVLSISCVTIAVAQPPEDISDSSFEYWADFEEETFNGITGGGTIVESSFEDSYSMELAENDQGGVTANTPGEMNISDGESMYYRYKTSGTLGDSLASEVIISDGGSHDGNIEVHTDGDGYPSDNDAQITLVRGTPPGEVADELDTMMIPDMTKWHDTYIDIIPIGGNEYTVDVYVWESGTIPPVTPQLSANITSGMSTVNSRITVYNNEVFQYDEIAMEEAPTTGFNGTISGKDHLNEFPLENANVTLRDGNSVIDTTTTDSNGEYNFRVEPGNYTIGANKTGWISDEKSVTLVDERTVDFTLRNKSEAFEFRASNFMEHGSTQEYSAVFDSPDSPTFEGVTSETTVTSENSSIVSVNSANNSLVATSNVSINNRTTITAEYVRDNQTYTSVQEITVANRTMENIEIMPPSQYIPAALGFGEEGTVFGIGSEIQWVLLSVFIGSAAAWIARNEWVGVGIIIATHVFFWVLGNISLGITMVAVFYGLMAAYQLNKIPGRSDTNVGGNQDSPPPQPPQQ